MFLWSEMAPEEKLKMAFKTYDVDRNGKLGKEEVKNLIQVSDTTVEFTPHVPMFFGLSDIIL